MEKKYRHSEVHLQIRQHQRLNNTIVLLGDNDLAQYSDNATMPGGEEGALPKNTKTQKGSLERKYPQLLSEMIHCPRRRTQTKSLKSYLMSAMAT